MAQPVRSRSANLPVERDSDSDDSASTVGAALSHSGGSPGQAGKPPAVSATSATSAAHLQNASTTPPSPMGKAGATGSQPAYAPGQTPSTRELALRASADLTRVAMQAKDPLKALKTIFKNANEVRLVLPAFFSLEQKSDPYGQVCGQKWLKQLPIRHLDLRLAPTPADFMGRLNQMAFVSTLLTNCRDLWNGVNPNLTVDLDLPLCPGTMGFNSMERMYAKYLYDALAKSNVVVRVRVKDYQPELNRLGSLVSDNEILGGNRKITELELADCEFDNEVASQLARALETNTSIKTLVLNNCSIPEVGSAALAKAFSQRPDMKVVGFRPGPGASPAPHGSPTGSSGRTAIRHSASAAISSTASTAEKPAVNTAGSSTATTTTTPAANTSSSATTSTTSTPAGYFRTARFNAAHEQDLADAAAEAQAALKEDDPVPALKRLFNQRAAIRIDVPAKILWKVDDANGLGDGYEKFSGVKCLSRLKLRDIEFRPQPCQAGESQSSQLDFMAYTLDSLSQLPKNSLVGTTIAIVAPDIGTAEEGSVGTVRAQDGLFKSLAHDRLTARLDLGSLAPRTEGSAALCRFFDSLPGKTRLAELRLCGAVLSRAETMALADGLRDNKSIQVLDLTGVVLDASVRDRFEDAIGDRPDLKVIY